MWSIFDFRPRLFPESLEGKTQQSARQMSRILKAIVAIFMVMLWGSTLAAGGERPADREVAPIKVRPFSLKQVRLLNGPCKAALERNTRYLHDLDSDGLLYAFRLTASLPTPGEPLGGWEAPGALGGGSFTGHYLSACALMYASTGDEKLKAKAENIVAELAKCQDALKSGYLGALPEKTFDYLEAEKQRSIAWYPFHKIMAGLLDMCLLCDNDQALATARTMAAWAKKRTDRLSEDEMQRTLEREFGGMNEVLANLYAITGDRTHLQLAHRFGHKKILDPLATDRDNLSDLHFTESLDHLGGLHANTTIPKIIGAAREYELTGKRYYQAIATFFWRQVVNTRCYCTGGTSNGERWRHDPPWLSSKMRHTTQETCCTYNMLKLTRHLFAWTADPYCADYYERAFWNGILPTQNPEDGMLMYHTLFSAGYVGYWKMFSLPRDSFWCCVGTGIESFSKLGDSIYFHDDDAVFVNLFIASELNWPEKGVRLRQETSFPEQAGTTLIVLADKPVQLSLHVRIPYWATRGGQVKVNGKSFDAVLKPSSYLTLKRTWKNGDRLEVALPMSLRLNRIPKNTYRPHELRPSAFMYGPLVLAGQLGSEDLPREAQYGQRNGGRILDVKNFKTVKVPALVPAGEDLNAWVKPVVGKPLTFRTVEQKQDVTLVPLYKLFGQRFAVYWQIHFKDMPTEGEWPAP